MNHRFHIILILTVLLASAQTNAQGLRLNFSPSMADSTDLTQRSVDFIVAVVNSEPVTNNEVRRELQRTLQQLALQHQPQPDLRVLAPEVLESLIGNRVQLQYAHETGIRVDDAAVDQAEQTIAKQNRIDVAELHRTLERDGLTVSQFHVQLKDQITLQRLREREVEPRVRVTEQDIDQYLHEQQTNQDMSKVQLNLAQILIKVPESATEIQADDLQSRANKALERARARENFVRLVKEYSDISDQAQGGELGLRPADRYPGLFVEATRQLAVGEISKVVKSPAGFHILKVIEKINQNLPASTITQSHARHILLRPGGRVSEADAISSLNNIRKKVRLGRADFAALARENSQDGSAAQGGDLGWANPGMFVPEFEEAMNRLAPGEISEPLVSRFGVHLIQMLERRQAGVSTTDQRDIVRAALRDKKLDEAYRAWAQDLRSRAYIEMREPPQ